MQPPSDRSLVAKVTELLRSPIAREAFRDRLVVRFWKPMAWIASWYRRLLLRRVRLVVVVGSVGKSTATRATTHALGLTLPRFTGANAFGAVPIGLLGLRPWRRRAVQEVGIGMPGQMAVHRETLRPDVVVVTAITSDHNLSLPTLEATRAEKSEMLRGLSPNGIAVLNADDPNVMWMRGVTRARIVTYGFGDGADVRASDWALDWPGGTTFTVHARGRSVPMRSKLLGRTTIYPMLAAVAVALEEGCELEMAVGRLATMEPVGQRLQPVHLPSGAIVVRDDYKAGLETVHAALDMLETVPARRRIVVLGDVDQCPEPRKTHYRALGEKVGRIAQRAIFLGIDSRLYATGAGRGGLSRESIETPAMDFDAALKALPPDLGDGDVILLKGRTRQRLGRVALHLQGRTVGCRVGSCPLKTEVMCDDCEHLERGVDAGVAAGNAPASE